MKKYLLTTFLFLLCLACNDSKLHQEFEMSIKEDKTICNDWYGQVPCYQVQKGENIGTETWTPFLNQIVGFTYQPGFRYKLVVRMEQIKQPLADASDEKYTLVREVAKEKKL